MMIDNKVLRIKQESRGAAEKFGQLIKERRKELGMSQKVLAELASIQRADLSRIENGHRPEITYMMVARISQALNMEVEFVPQD